AILVPQFHWSAEVTTRSIWVR
ncbi:unnamed protein product, partial [Allacma fusca]